MEYQKKDIILQNPRDRNKIAFVLSNVFSPEECRALIDRAELQGFVKALVNIGNGREKAILDYRNSDRCIIDDPDFSLDIFSRVRRYLPEIFEGRSLVSVNERLRILKYTPGNFFRKHCDSSYFRPENGEESKFTLQIYLNEGSVGGATRFHSRYEPGGPYTDVIPRTGSVLIFQHDLLHEGALVSAGTKYALRTDIMYSASPSFVAPAPAVVPDFVAQSVFDTDNEIDLR